MNGAIARVLLQRLFNQLGLPILVIDMAVCPESEWMAFYSVSLMQIWMSDLIGIAELLAGAINVSVSIWQWGMRVNIVLYSGWDYVGGRRTFSR